MFLHPGSTSIILLAMNSLGILLKLEGEFSLFSVSVSQRCIRLNDLVSHLY
jgi:hypothetical protein